MKPYMVASGALQSRQSHAKAGMSSPIGSQCRAAAIRNRTAG